jgi:hypothetical protein
VLNVVINAWHPWSRDVVFPWFSQQFRDGQRTKMRGSKIRIPMTWDDLPEFVKKNHAELCVFFFGEAP